ncbi:MAG: winged helix DNA-binding domain-containing protein, partial [Gemmatimonadales bacterium]|nr:winged helix DNA-binding domain-containing protein [Gemmatimonadales bacterium]
MDLLRQRLYTQRLSGPPLERPEDVVRLLGAVQSQDYPGAKWSLGQRVRNGTDAAVDEAFSSGRILRTHILRPTWHFVAPDDIRWMLQLSAPRVQALNAHRYRQLELDQALLRRSAALFARALESGNHLTRTELAAVLSRGRIAAAGARLAHAVMHAELEGVICSGALRGKRHTYALLEERASLARILARDEAVAELTHRFFSGHGPATPAHCAWWSGLRAADVR